MGALAVALSACGGNGPATSPQQFTINTLPAGSTLALPAHAGTEVIDFGNAPTEGTTVSNAASGSLAITATGFDLTLPNPSPGSPSGSATVSYNTTGGGQIFESCFGVCGSLQSRTTVTTILTSGAPSTLNYATYGVWTARGIAYLLGEVRGVFAGGIPTPSTQRPTTGTATYSGKADGFITSAAFADYERQELKADISLTADFAANTISGNVTNALTTATNRGTTGAAGVTNNIALTGGTITGTSFAGNAAAVATTGTSVDISGATGGFGGAFYGPNAAEAAGSLALTGTGLNVIASFGAKK